MDGDGSHGVHFEHGGERGGGESAAHLCGSCAVSDVDGQWLCDGGASCQWQGGGQGGGLLRDAGK